MKLLDYDFGEILDTQEELIKNGPGVYVVICVKNGSPHCVLDIGETKSPKQRFNNHERENCWENHTHGEIKYLHKRVKGGRSEREKVEHELQWKIDPPCSSLDSIDNIIDRFEDSLETWRETKEKWGKQGCKKFKLVDE